MTTIVLLVLVVLMSPRMDNISSSKVHREILNNFLEKKDVESTIEKIRLMKLIWIDSHMNLPSLSLGFTFCNSLFEMIVILPIISSQ